MTAVTSIGDQGSQVADRGAARSRSSSRPSGPGSRRPCGFRLTAAHHCWFIRPLERQRIVNAPTALGGAGTAEKPRATAKTTTESEASSSGEADEAILQTGRKVFLVDAVPSCTICHTLADADASGQIGPNLDQLQPSLEVVRQAVDGGVGIMPAYGGHLSAAQIEAVAQYVSTVTAEEP